MVSIVVHYCLPTGQFVKNKTMSVQFSSVTSLCIPTRLYDCEAVSSASGQVAIEWFVLGWVTVCMWSLWTGKPSQYITNIKANLAFHSSGVGKSSTGLSGWGSGGARSPMSGCR